MDEMAVKSAIPFIKDVDCATAESLGAVMAGSPGCLPYCAPAAVMELLSHYGVGLKGKYVTIVGSGLVVGKPLSMLMVDKLATVSLCNIFTPDIAPLTRQADILVSACGVAGLISGRHVREGQIVVDVGTTYENGKLLGDVNLEEVSPIVAAVTPTPGGVSGITSTVLAKHVVLAAKRQAP
jgi:methylenetetrahydrofolate dehydrogenase (NADP+)/methenyltetrahydrofolate cyclohydrolase